MSQYSFKSIFSTGQHGLHAFLGAPGCTQVQGIFFSIIFIVLFISPPWEERAVPGGTAIPGQPVAKVEQAPTTSPRFKNQFNIEVPV